ncbi:xanthine dehydrogenase family protein molybdopterin-binding subunit [Variovorax paradoxus]|uniref:xanthine dehydrogenase family protein molybdopterin-binding subunit n=1 Tax=Variovorax paradoxus TaxID=34073 RepID=UPI002786C32C|nr:xanthine dehydrogenase family protein molybdopterin-binding subunit [Variovorax paradoxus]MDP9932804.1 carbon-monoxide dehydrogenase large subunit [Variovorax paradoxus]
MLLVTAAFIPSPEHAISRPSRREDAALLRGAGRYVGDISLPGMLHALFIRSPYAHARVLKVATHAAAACDGVAAVLTAADLAGVPRAEINALLPGMRAPEGDLLAVTHVRSIGEPVALVVAQSIAQAEAAVGMVDIEYEELAPVLPFAEPGTTWGGSGDPLVAEIAFASGALRDEAPTATVSVEMPRVSPAPLEPRACLAAWDATAGTMTAWLSTQTPSRARADIAGCLGIPLASVRVIAPDVGGAFGGKASIFPEDLMVAFAARLLACPVRWQSTRSEDLQYATHGRGSHSCGAIWLDTAGSIVAAQASFEFSLGHWLPYSALAPMRNAQRIFPGPYRMAGQQSRATARLSNTAAVNIYRGAGRPEAAVLMERLVDAAACAAGIEPLELRLRSVWPAEELPVSLPNGETLDKSDLAGLLRQASEAFDYNGRRQEQAQRQRAGELVGIGIGLYVEPCGQGWESARVTCTAPGHYTVATGTTAQGQGRETAFSAIAAAALGCDPSKVTVLHGDTASCPPGIGALASRSTPIGGSAVLVAATRLKNELEAGAALPHVVEEVHHAASETWASGCVICQVAVDRDTGTLTIEHLTWVDDAGQVIDPVLVRGQMLGGMAQGIGQALLERVVYDENGQLLTGSFMDYAMPRADDMPRAIHLESRPTRSSANPLGAKGVGEAGCIGVPAALLNAAHDALGNVPGRDLQFPLTPERLWRAIQAQN